ncbi:hypothetical protein Vafri_18747, partial [Volvox africanus]
PLSTLTPLGSAISTSISPSSLLSFAMSASPSSCPSIRFCRFPAVPSGSSGSAAAGRLTGDLPFLDFCFEPLAPAPPPSWRGCDFRAAVCWILLMRLMYASTS